MAIRVEQIRLEGTRTELLDAVTAEVGVDTRPPTAFVVNVHLVRDDAVHDVDVWGDRSSRELFAHP